MSTGNCTYHPPNQFLNFARYFRDRCFSNLRDWGDTLSPASGFEDDMFGDVAVWLVEPRRTTSVVKYSGTLVHPTRRDQVGIIVTAFAHYIYETSNKELVLADIQGIVLYHI